MLLYFVLLLFDCFHCWVSLFCFQILRRDRYDKSCDMWSLGVVMYILYVRYFLFAIFLFFLSLREILKWLRRGFVYEFWKEIQEFTKSIGVSSYYEDRNEIYSELGFFFVWILVFFLHCTRMTMADLKVVMFFCCFMKLDNTQSNCFFWWGTNCFPQVKILSYFFSSIWRFSSCWRIYHVTSNINRRAVKFTGLLKAYFSEEGSFIMASVVYFSKILSCTTTWRFGIKINFRQMNFD